MNTVIAWIIVFALLCVSITIWTISIHKHSDDDSSSNIPSCDGNCFSCAKNISGEISKPDECDDK